MKKSQVLAGLSLVMGLAVVASGVSVAQDAIAKRREYMKSVGAAAKQSNEMIKGDRPFDAKAAAEALTKVSASYADYAKLYPKGTETGGETTASPKIWEDPKGFAEKGEAFAKAAAAAADAAGKGKDAFAEAFKGFGGTCKSCHEVYRIQKK
jgi:cytochrome c556